MFWWKKNSSMLFYKLMKNIFGKVLQLYNVGVGEFLSVVLTWLGESNFSAVCGQNIVASSSTI